MNARQVSDFDVPPGPRGLIVRTLARHPVADARMLGHLTLWLYVGGHVSFRFAHGSRSILASGTILFWHGRREGATRRIPLDRVGTTRPLYSWSLRRKATRRVLRTF